MSKNRARKQAGRVQLAVSIFALSEIGINILERLRLRATLRAGRFFSTWEVESENSSSSFCESSVASNERPALYKTPVVETFVRKNETFSIEYSRSGRVCIASESLFSRLQTPTLWRYENVPA